VKDDDMVSLTEECLVCEVFVPLERMIGLAARLVRSVASEGRGDAQIEPSMSRLRCGKRRRRDEEMREESGFFQDA
jgi:hypothetical protein